MRPAARKARVERAVEAQAAQAGALARKIHELAEPPFEEVESARLTAEFLANNGFRVAFPFKNIPTAFRAEQGRGRPVVGMLGEYDALPDCGPAPGSWGHGCSHNLLGAGAAAGAAAAAAVLRAMRRPGKIVFYGCPAEEALAGKVYMARDGAFRDLDACLAWHPGGGTGVNNAGGSALDSLVYEFFGRTAHGAHAAGGRSALDAVILFDVAVNYLREHIPENVRIHSVIPDGGRAPNVVPAYAKIWYYVRGEDRAQVDAVRKRLERCARGAALATETRFKVTRLTAIYPRLPNDALARLLLENVRLIGPTPVRPADRKRARASKLSGEFNTRVGDGFGSQGRASSDEDTVSWLAPLGRFGMLCSPQGARGHHRDGAAQAATPFAIRGMLQAAKVFAAAALDLCERQDAMRAIRAEFRRRTQGFTYDPLIPKRQKIPGYGS
ncbi:MAG: amidohydrolase [Kiritimatiellae bacterium]|nr:amidohydrolase [Kiritimatiellia bacterium]